MILGKAITLKDSECRQEDGMIKPDVRMVTTEKLLSTVVDLTWGKQIANGINPVIRISSEPRRLLVDLIYQEVDEPYKALEWKTSSFNVTMFRLNVEEAAKEALISWGKRDHKTVFWANDTQVKSNSDREISHGIALLSGRRN